MSDSQALGPLVTIVGRLKFISSCDAAFDKFYANNWQRVSLEAAATNVSNVFKNMQATLTLHGVAMGNTSQLEVMTLCRESHWEPSRRLTKAEYRLFTSRCMHMIVNRAARSAVRGYTPPALQGFGYFVLLRHVLRAVPVVNIVSPILDFFPALLVGPVLGVVASYKSRRRQG